MSASPRSATTSRLRATSPAACASTAAPARRTCASRRASSASIATARSRTMSRCPSRSSGRTTGRSCRRRSPPSRSRSATRCSRPSTQDLAGHTVAVLGCGPVGLFTIALARASGAGRVLASDHLAYRLELARSLGAEAVDVDNVVDTDAWFRDRNEGEGLDVVFEMSGAGGAVRDAFRIVRNGGSVVLFGIPSEPIELDIAESLIFKNVRVLGGKRPRGVRHLVSHPVAAGARRCRPSALHHAPLRPRGLRAGIHRARVGRGVQDRPPIRRPFGAGLDRRLQALVRCERDHRHRRQLDALARCRDVQALQHAAFTTRAGRRDGGPRRGDRPLLEQLPRARGRPARRRCGHPRPPPLRRGHRIGAVHLRHVRAAPRARAGHSPTSPAPRRR